MNRVFAYSLGYQGWIPGQFHLWPSSDDLLPSIVVVYRTTWCDRQQLWKAVITEDTATNLSIPIRGRGKSPEEGQRWNLAET